MSKKPLDSKDWRLLAALQADARAPLKTLAADIGLSLAATAERIKRLEADGVITGYHTDIDLQAAGYPIMALVAITSAQPHKEQLLNTLGRMTEVLECHHVTGADSYMITMVAKSIAHLEQLVGSINAYGETRSSIVMSSPIPRRAPRAAAE
ncbi:Lrp/AsnC family transcriptional regulator [Chitinimonas sp.]|uniref:Lrp/AsnC family transcriptional regulator n=1 Tax=Chitinimonas sp. TaxID=1934313 RepID=UPI0035AFE3AD